MRAKSPSERRTTVDSLTQKMTKNWCTIKLAFISTWHYSLCIYRNFIFRIYSTFERWEVFKTNWIFRWIRFAGTICIREFKSLCSVGLTLTTAISLFDRLQWGVILSSETEIYLTSIERLLEYAKLEPEPSLGIGFNLIQIDIYLFILESYKVNDQKQEKLKFNKKNARNKLNSILFDDKPSPTNNNFSKEGEVCFENFDFNYFTDGPKVLKSLTFTVKPGEKVGIGRLI